MSEIKENVYFSSRESAYIPKVEDQGLAGTCCIFASLSALSWAVAIKYRKYPPTFSPQHCVDHIIDLKFFPLYQLFTGTRVDIVLDFLKTNGATLSCNYRSYSGIIQPANNALFTGTRVDIVLDFLKTNGATLSCNYRSYSGIIQPANNAYRKYPPTFSPQHCVDHIIDLKFSPFY
ncbi:hypothetical protein LIER_17006 [Lithospermum erythrorhizon]|uniref:Peptidase C1A papain C-terminal domain-containing protein n=1 Tax=Lithospermum erythrorhizon TaxID=34254 RepID=A0AAV3QBC8_LITER